MWISAWLVIAALCMAGVAQMLHWLSKHLMDDRLDSGNFAPGCFGYLLSLALGFVALLVFLASIVVAIIEWITK